MLQHGQLVHEYYCDILDLVNKKETRFKWDIPEKTLEQLSSFFIDAHMSCEVKDYHLYHDNAKHISLHVDETGRQHFPNHAHNSYLRWLECGGDGITAYLIANDMFFHTASLSCIT